MAGMDQLTALALDQHGYFSLAQAVEHEVSDAYVRKLAASGRLERCARGVYRIAAAPYTPMSEYMEAILWTRERGVIAGISALELWDLADVNPTVIHITVPADQRIRRSDANKYRIHHRTLNPDDLDHVQNIPVATPAYAIAQAIEDGLDTALVDQAIDNAQARELINKERAARLRVALYDRHLP